MLKKLTRLRSLCKQIRSFYGSKRADSRDYLLLIADFFPDKFSLQQRILLLFSPAFVIAFLRPTYTATSTPIASFQGKLHQPVKDRQPCYMCDHISYSRQSSPDGYSYLVRGQSPSQPLLPGDECRKEWIASTLSLYP